MVGGKGVVLVEPIWAAFWSNAVADITGEAARENKPPPPPPPLLGLGFEEVRSCG